jgi:hypothetical protein
MPHPRFSAFTLLLLSLSLCACQAGAQTRRKTTRPPAKSAAGENRITLSGSNQSVTSFLTRIMATVHANYTMDPALQESYATVNLTRVTVAVALDALAKASTRPFRYVQENGVYHFTLRDGFSIDNMRVNVQAQNAGLANVIHSLMNEVHANYAVDQDIEGSRTASITINLTQVPFLVALDSLIKASSMPIACRIETGGKPGLPLYHFMMKAKADELEGKASGRIRYTDASLQPGGELTDKHLSQDFSGVFFSHALKTLLDSVPARFEIDASVEDTPITLHLQDVAFPTALGLLVKASGQTLTTHFDNGILRIIRRGAMPTK